MGVVQKLTTSKQDVQDFDPRLGSCSPRHGYPPPHPDYHKRRRSNHCHHHPLGRESSFAIISQLEPAQCIRRLICDVATGALPAAESDEVILAPFKGTSLADADVSAHSFDYLVAQENGKNFKSVEKCELRYSCPLSAGQLREIFNEA